MKHETKLFKVLTGFIIVSINSMLLGTHHYIKPSLR